MLFSNYFLISLAVYVVAESLAPIFHMGAGLKNVCLKVKYIMIIVLVVKTVYELHVNGLPANFTDFIVVITLTLVVWPCMVTRLKNLGHIKG